MYRQQAERLAAKIGAQDSRLLVEIYQDGVRASSWLVRAYDPASAQTLVFSNQREATLAMDTMGRTSGETRAM